MGAGRAFRTGRTVTTDRIVALDPCRRLAYEDAFGLHFVMRRTMNRTMQRMATGLARAGDVNPG